MYRIQKWVMGTLACAVALGTGYVLIRPGWALEQSCTLTEHTHTDACYSQVTKIQQTLQCPFGIHSHDDSCRDGNGDLVCGMADYVIHSHNEYCVDAAGTLICTLAEVEKHQHSDECGEACPKEEILPHVHSDADGCYTYENDQLTLVCEKPVLLEHDHNGTCVAATDEEIVIDVLTCGMEAHTHSDLCQAGQEAQILTVEETAASAAAREDDLATVTGDGIRFQLFNYSLNINKISDGSAWRPISKYFTFRNSALPKGDTPSNTVHIPSWNCNTTYDADGFTDGHATVEWHLSNGLPVLSLTRNPNPKGNDRADPGVDATTRSLAYLFSSGDHAVTAYAPSNTILQKSDNHYYYNSRDNAVDYDPEANVFRLRSYAERNSTTADHGTSYGDFIPFTYTNGTEIGKIGSTPYHVNSADVDYWFGMTMEVDFFQTRDGLLDGEEMVFSFSGDDDVWVFVDDVLVLDLGGTHGTATGSINFATGKVTQYLSWNGGTAESSTTSFPTTIRACFDSAGATPNGGWNADGTSFAPYTEHTLKFFYMERGSAVANCLLDFRLPTLPDKSLTVTKDLVPSENSSVTDFLKETLSYKFRVVKADVDGQPTEELFLQPGTSYTLLSGGSSAGSGSLDDDGYFTLKAGQSAQFTDMLAKGGGAVDYIVQEFLPTDLTGQYGGVEYEVSGAAGSIEAESGELREFTTFSTGVLPADTTQTVTYRNKVDVSQLSNLNITKQAGEASLFPEGQRFQIQVTLGGELLPVGTAYAVDGEARTVTAPGILELEVGQTAAIGGILSGTSYAITELGTEDGLFTPTYSGTGGTVTCTAKGASGVLSLNSTVCITVTNHGSYALPNTGGFGTRQFYLSGLLLMAASLLTKKARREGSR